MADTIRPNCGPYKVTYNARLFTKDGVDEFREEECQTWDDACRFMRSLLIDGYEITGVCFC